MRSTISFRNALPTDIPFVVDSWVASYRNAHAAGMISMENWAVVMIPEVYKVISRPGVKVLVAYHPDEPKESDAYGYAVVEHGMRYPVRERVGRRTEKRMVEAEGPVVHYVYVKQLYRRMGIARALLESADVSDQFIYSCKTGVCSKIDRLKSCKWMPLLVRYPKDEVEDDDGIA